MSVLALREARRHVRSFADESELLPEHEGATECLDCEAFLQVGIDAFHWLIRADETIRLATYRRLLTHNPRVEQSLHSLARAWLQSSEAANRWIEFHQQRGERLENLDEFCKCEAEMRAMVRAQGGDTMTDAMRALRDSAVAEHRNGETADFV